MSDSPHFIKLPRTIIVDEDVGSEERENKKAQVPPLAISDASLGPHSVEIWLKLELQGFIVGTYTGSIFLELHCT